jgi:two-component system, LytTR family, sensor histidine kinase AlgZ
MHPILVSGRRLAAYMLAWVPLLALMVYVAWATTGMSWGDGAAVLAPACLIFAFDCLSTWYIARVRPLSLATAPSLFVTWLVAGIGGGLTLAGCAWIAGWLMNKPVAGRFALFFAMGLLLYLLSAGLHYAGLAIESSRLAERHAAEAKTLAREAQLQALRFQINPHFLFNSLNSIAALATLDGPRARDMCVRLAEFLRSSLGLEDRERIPLEEELALARSYLEVERVRFGDRLRVEEEIEPECRKCGVPPLLLQPLVENAVKHGIAGLVEGGSIKIGAKWRNGAVVITLENSFDPDGSSAPGRLGMGLAHVRRRLSVRYGEEAEMDAERSDGVYKVVLRLPCDG